MEAGFLALVALSILKGLSLFLSYITNNAFPQPLSEAEEQKYLELWQQGNQQARNVLIEHNLRLVAHITKKFENTGEDTEDLISIGTVGLIKAINTYNKDKGTKLATYAARCIENDNSITKSMEFHYYADTDTLYIDLSEKESTDSAEAAPGVVLDYRAAI